MKLYCTTYVDDAENDWSACRAKWYGTQADQKKDAKQLKADGMRDIEQQQTIVPTDKAALIAFLNGRNVQP